MAHRDYIIGIGGLTQGYGIRHGMLILDMKLQKFRSPTVSVDYFPWYAPWADIAERIAMETEQWENVRIVVCAYSYGAGWGFLKLAHELGERELTIQTAVLCDPVYRSPWFIGKLMAFAPWSVIRVPDNVREVYSFFQRMTRPCGHRVVAMNEQATKIHDPVQLHASHVNCDNSKNFHNLCMRIAEDSVKETAIETAVSNQTTSQEIELLGDEDTIV